MGGAGHVGRSSCCRQNSSYPSSLPLLGKGDDIALNRPCHRKSYGHPDTNIIFHELLFYCRVIARLRLRKQHNSANEHDPNYSSIDSNSIDSSSRRRSSRRPVA